MAHGFRAREKTEQNSQSERDIRRITIRRRNYRTRLAASNIFTILRYTFFFFFLALCTRAQDRRGGISVKSAKIPDAGKDMARFTCRTVQVRKWKRHGDAERENCVFATSPRREERKERGERSRSKSRAHYTWGASVKTQGRRGRGSFGRRGNSPSFTVRRDTFTYRNFMRGILPAMGPRRAATRHAANNTEAACSFRVHRVMKPSCMRIITYAGNKTE